MPGVLGEKLGEEIEQEFTKKAKETGLSEEETKNAFNKNMMSSGFLCEGPGDFGRRYNRKWLVTSYEAGDVVLHTPHMVSLWSLEYSYLSILHADHKDIRFMHPL